MESRNQDPFFNLAFEEYLLRREEQDFFVIWQSVPSVVVGKHQNALAEVNYPFITKNGIPLARRLSGGGTVYHGPGNLNFTYVVNGEAGKLVDFNRFISPIIQFLETLGVKAEAGPRHEILINGKKISGNSEHVHKNRVLHHGTLLFNADLNFLREAIRVTPGKYTDKAVQSVRSSVANLSGFLSSTLNLEEFSHLFMQFIRDHFEGQSFHPAEETLAEVSEVAVSKYKSREWILGWSPDYEFHGMAHFSAGKLEIRLKVHKAFITGCTLSSMQISGDSLKRLHDLLIGSPHDAENILIRLRESGITGCNHEKCLEEAVYDFF